ncbi:glycosyltransferase [Taibaiella koreensis]|uniref:glycosyltransferase n=1 Tax=Taibaiella koreensis TaxID=1268548 RepID=UPI0013C2F47D|nr:glycosyltransferase [Taibaiella koreensis]
MRVLHIINNLGSGGAEKLLVNGLPRYKALGFEMEILQLNGTASVPDYIASLEEMHIPVYDLGLSNVYHPAGIKKIRHFVRNADRNYDIIHVHLFPAMYWAALALRNAGIPLVFTEHNTRNRRWGKFYFRRPDRYIYGRYKKIIAITDEVKIGLEHWIGGNREKIIVIKNGIDIDKFNHIQAIERTTLLRSLNIDSEHTRLLLMTARFDTQKNHKRLLEAMTSMPEHIHLLLAGRGPLEEEARSFCDQLGIKGRVHFLGFRNDVASLMKSVDISILSSHYEGLSGVALESLASGRPFLGSDVSGINNIVPDHRFLFAPENNGVLEEKISGILEDTNLREGMIRDAALFLKAYDIHIMIQNHVHLYHNLK